MDKVMEKLELKIKQRMYKRLEKVHFTNARILETSTDYSEGSYYIAGNSCNVDAPHDIDIYPVNMSKFNFKAGSLEKFCNKNDCKVICKTANAVTIKTPNGVLQFCNYVKHSLEDLVESFDFAHIKIGVRVGYELDNFNDMSIDTVYLSKDWLAAKLDESSFYAEPDVQTGYPLSSLLRINKYIARGNFKGSYKAEVLKILIAFLHRGFIDYADFKDQLAAVDLLLLEPSEKNAAWLLWLTCCGCGLVKNKDTHVKSVAEFIVDLERYKEELQED